MSALPVSPSRHSSEGWNLNFFPVLRKGKEIPAFAGMTASGSPDYRQIRSKRALSVVSNSYWVSPDWAEATGRS